MLYILDLQASWKAASHHDQIPEKDAAIYASKQLGKSEKRKSKREKNSDLIKVSHEEEASIKSNSPKRVR